MLFRSSLPSAPSRFPPAASEDGAQAPGTPPLGSSAPGQLPPAWPRFTPAGLRQHRLGPCAQPRARQGAPGQVGRLRPGRAPPTTQGAPGQVGRPETDRLQRAGPLVRRGLAPRGRRGGGGGPGTGRGRPPHPSSPAGSPSRGQLGLCVSALGPGGGPAAGRRGEGRAEEGVCAGALAEEEQDSVRGAGSGACRDGAARSTGPGRAGPLGSCGAARVMPAGQGEPLQRVQQGRGQPRLHLLWCPRGPRGILAWLGFSA